NTAIPRTLRRAAVEGERCTVEADLGPVRYLATLLGAGERGRVEIFHPRCCTDPGRGPVAARCCEADLMRDEIYRSATSAFLVSFGDSQTWRGRQDCTVAAPTSAGTIAFGNAKLPSLSLATMKRAGVDPLASRRAASCPAHLPHRGSRPPVRFCR